MDKLVRKHNYKLKIIKGMKKVLSIILAIIIVITSLSLFAFAREEETKKGMDGSQITGACSSYARKYALNGLFLIDDVKDSDSTNTGKDEEDEERLQLAYKIKTTMQKKKILPNEISEHFEKNSADMTNDELKQVLEVIMALN